MLVGKMRLLAVAIITKPLQPGQIKMYQGGAAPTRQSKEPLN
jgi:hypothetical protein